MRRLGASLVRTALVAGAVVAASLGGAALVQAVGAADQSAIVHGCYAKKDGLLRIVEPGVTCGQDVQLDWPRTGIDGPAGPAGATGGAGDQGSAGSAGPSGADGRPLGIDRVTAAAAGAGRHTAEAQCPAGEQALSGGWSAADGRPVSVVENAPTDGYRGWRVVADRGGRWTLTVTALCGRAAGAPAEPPVPDAGSPRAACGVACLPATMTLSDAVASGIPVVVITKRPGFTVSVALRSRTGVVGLVRRRATAAGALKLDVPLTARSARRLMERRVTRLTARITIRRAHRAPAVITRRLTVRS